MGDLRALGEADAPAHGHAHRRGARWRAVQHERSVQNAAPVVRERQRERLAEPAGAAREQAFGCACGQAAQRAHALGPGQRLESTQQHGGAAPARLAHHVRAGVQAVAAVDVQPSRRPEHRAVAPGLAAVGVRARIAAVAGVGLDLDDAPGQACAVREPVHDHHAEQVARHLGAGAVEEGAFQRGAEAHVSLRWRAPAWAGRNGALS
jgi:hypothetical protein